MARTLWRKLGMLGAGSVLALSAGCIAGDDVLLQLLLFILDTAIFNQV